MKVPVSENPSPETGKTPEDFPKTTVSLDALISHDVSICEALAVCSYLSAAEALRSQKRPIPLKYATVRKSATWKFRTWKSPLPKS